MPDACRRWIDHRSSVTRQPNLHTDNSVSYITLGQQESPSQNQTKRVGSSWGATPKFFLCPPHNAHICTPTTHALTYTNGHVHAWACTHTHTCVCAHAHAYTHTHKVSRGQEHCWWRYIGTNISKESKQEAWWPAEIWNGERKCAKVLARLGHKLLKGTRD